MNKKFFLYVINLLNSIFSRVWCSGRCTGSHAGCEWVVGKQCTRRVIRLCLGCLASHLGRATDFDNLKKKLFSSVFFFRLFYHKKFQLSSGFLVRFSLAKIFWFRWSYLGGVSFSNCVNFQNQRTKTKVSHTNKVFVFTNLFQLLVINLGRGQDQLTALLLRIVPEI